MTKPIPTFVHGIADYLGGIVLLLAPHIFGFADRGDAAVWIPRILGVVVLLQAVATRYELGLLKVVPMRGHLMMDYVAGLFLAASPFLFGFYNAPNNVWLPHVIVGIGVFVLTLLTQTEPRHRDVTSTTASVT
jgi:hypothetical protein